MTVAPDLPSLFALPPRFALPSKSSTAPGSGRRAGEPVVIPFPRIARAAAPPAAPPAPAVPSGERAPSSPWTAPDRPAEGGPVLRLPVALRPVHVVQAMFPAPPSSAPSPPRAAVLLPGSHRPVRSRRVDGGPVGSRHCGSAVRGSGVGPSPAAAGRRRPATAGRMRLTRRGRVVVAVVVLLLSVATAVLVVRAAEGLSERLSDRSAVPASAPAVVTVRPGDTLWGIARRIAPDRDTRAVVAELQRVNLLPTGEVRAGQRLRLRGP